MNGVIAKIDNEKENAYIKTLADKSGKIYSPILNVVLYCYLLYLHYIIRKAYIATIELIERGKPGELILMNDGIFDVGNVSGHLII